MFERLKGGDSFFDAFEAHAEKTLEGARLLRDLLEECRDPPEFARRIKQIEDDGDAITHRTIEMLHRTFVAPLDRHHIHRLITRMDDVLDRLEAAAEQVWLYEVHEPSRSASELAGILVRAVEAISRTLPALRDIKNARGVQEACIEVHRLENEADEILRAAVADLFASKSEPLYVLKWKDIYDQIETATDHCEHVANVIEAIFFES